MALRRLGYRHLTGTGVERDPLAAFADFSSAASAGDVHSLYNLGYMHLKVRVLCCAAATRWAGVVAGAVKRCNSTGGANASAVVGACVPQGHGVPQNASAAREYFEQAAGRGSAAGHNGLGILYHQAGWRHAVHSSLLDQQHTNHHAFAAACDASANTPWHNVTSGAWSAVLQGAGGLPRDLNRALQHFQSAADHSQAANADSLFNLGTMHAAGEAQGQAGGTCGMWYLSRRTWFSCEMLLLWVRLCARAC